MSKRAICLFVVLMLTVTVFSDDIIIDGDFSDWIDMPTARDTDDNDNSQPIVIEEPVTEITPESDETQSSPSEQETVDPQAQDATIDNNQSTQQEASQDNDSQESENDNSQSNAMPEMVVQSTLNALKTQPSSVKDTFDLSVSDDKNSKNDKNDKAKSNDKNTESNEKNKIHSVSWSMSENSDYLKIKVEIMHTDENSFVTEILSDFGDYEAVTSYNIEDGTVLTQINDTNIAVTEGACELFNKNKLIVEYALPVSELMENMKWGYMLKFRVKTSDSVFPKKDYIIVSTASTGAYTGVILCIILALAALCLNSKKKRKQTA